MGERKAGVSGPDSGRSEATGIAVVGYGNAGRQHVDALAGAAGAYAAAVVETDPAAASRARGAGLTVRALDEVLADDAVRALALCLPPGARTDVARAAVAAGKHLLLEKPPARTAEELAGLLSLADDGEVLAAVMFQHRFALPEPLRAIEPERFAGAVASLTVSRARPDAHYRQAGWRSDPRHALGGVTAHLGVHYLDLACQLLGTPRAVTPLSRTDAAPGIDTQLCGHIAFESGAQLSVAITSRSVARAEQLTVLGADAWLEVRSGAVTGEIDGRPIEGRTRPASVLRTEVYQEFSGAVAGRTALGLAALSRSRGVVEALDGLLSGHAPAARTAGAAR
ncbi:Gfo/Idh/MocA family oxidoreductase [Microbispora sp. NBRC 16548]|uniref:Gfo/Idh/MocA family protein n=1 Tax=Microbispora sp. NBRC 16548 TaxID=3030994 RepID=UPI00255470A3|nr:Gfo/Idh/MocA family oxidoreductase [Microbispora sp. NBRC 16548]